MSTPFTLNIEKNENSKIIKLIAKPDCSSPSCKISIGIDNKKPTKNIFPYFIKGKILIFGDLNIIN